MTILTVRLLHFIVPLGRIGRHIARELFTDNVK
jgi:hypothetical protein